MHFATFEFDLLFIEMIFDHVRASFLPSTITTLLTISFLLVVSLIQILSNTLPVIATYSIKIIKILLRFYLILVLLLKLVILFAFVAWALVLWTFDWFIIFSIHLFYNCCCSSTIIRNWLMSKCRLSNSFTLFKDITKSRVLHRLIFQRSLSFRTFLRTLLGILMFPWHRHRIMLL